MEKIKLIYNRINEFLQLCKENHLDSHSAAAAFFMFVSVIPFFILMLAIIPFTPLTDRNILNMLDFLLPEALDSFANSILMQLTNKSITAVSVSAVIAIWSAARSLLTIKEGLNEVYGIIDKRNFIFSRINAAFYTLILIFSIILLLILNVGMNAIERYFREVIGISILEEYSLLHFLIILRPFITIFIPFVLMMYLYKFLPNVKITFKSQIPGAVIGAIAWYVYSTVFGIYINNYNAYSMYGSLSVIIIVLIWLYACMYIVFLGAQFNYYLSLRRENNKIKSGNF